MSMKEKKIPQNIGESEEENEPGACGGNEPPMSLSAAEAILGGYLDESVDNLSMEVHLGDDNSRHPSEISSISYQNLLEDSEPSNSIRSRRGSDDSVESYPPDFPDAELPPDDMETFEASDLPLSEHFPMGSLQGNDSYKMRSLCSSDIVPTSRSNVKLKDSDSIKIREKNKVSHSNSIGKSEELSSKKRNSLEIRNNIPTVGEVKDYEKQMNLDKVQNSKPKMIGLKQSPGLARRVDIDSIDPASNVFSEGLKKDEDEEHDTSPPSLKAIGPKSKPKNNISRTSEGVIEVITPIPKNMNIENEYDYVKYARVQQGNSYVGMRLAYSSSNDSLNLKHAGGSVNSSRETSPEKVLQQKIISELGQSGVNEDNLTEIPLNNSDYSEDKKAFTLSPENTECDSVEVESVTSEGENSPAGFPTVEDGLSSSQASDAEEVGSGLASDRSPSKVLQNKQKASISQQLQDEEEFHGPQEMDAQAIMEDLKMKREALDMAIADIKSAIQRSKNMSLETSYNPEQDAEEVQPVWIKRDSSSQASKRLEELCKGKESLESQQDNQGAGKSTQERDEKEPNNNNIESGKSSQNKDENNKQIKSDCLLNMEAGPLGVEPQTNSFDIPIVSNSEVMSACGGIELNSEPTKQSQLTASLSMMETRDVKPITQSQDQSDRQCVNDAIASVSSEIIQNLGNSFVKKTMFGDIPQTEEVLKPSAVYEIESKDCDVSEFDVLASSQMKSDDPLVIEIPHSTEEPSVIEANSEHFNPDTPRHRASDSAEYYSPPSETGGSEIGENTVTQASDINADDDCDDDDQKEDNDKYAEEESEDNDGRVRVDGHPIGYDSDDECEDAEGIRYTRRNKGKKYAPLQKDDSLEFGSYGRRKDVPVSRSNGHTLSHASKNGSVCNNHSPSLEYEEQHLHRSDPTLSSEESSDIDAHINSYARPPNADSDTDEETDRLLQKQYQERDKHVEIPELNNPSKLESSIERDRRYSKAKEAAIRDPDRPEVLIEGVLFRARYLGSTQLISEGQPSKAMRMMQAQEAVGRIKQQNQGNTNVDNKAPEGENQPSTDVDLFVSTEKIMVLNTDLQEIMMDHSLRTISYIADIGDILVIMARRRLITSPDDILGRRRRQAKILCHVFESDEAQLIAQSIGQAFQVAYLEFLKANGIEDPGLLKEMDYQDVLNQQEIYGEELNLFANKDFHKEVIVPKAKNEPLGIVIVESGWGSMVPTVVLANMMPTGPAARCGQLNIGDQIISINGVSLVGLPLSACQTYIKASRTQTVVKLTVVPCPPVVEVLIKRPDVKYQLGFSVQNGVICSLLRGGIAERGGVRVGHRIIEINNQSVVAVPHEKIVTLLASSVGEIHMKTMPTSIFRLLTGQDVPHYL